VKFHDGTPMTGEDVKYSLMRFLLLDRDGGPSNLLLTGLLGARSTNDLAPDRIYDLADKAIAIEGGALVLRLKKPFAPLLGILANFAHVVPKAAVAAGVLAYRESGEDGTFLLTLSPKHTGETVVEVDGAPRRDALAVGLDELVAECGGEIDDANLAAFEVDVVPPQPDQLANAHPGPEQEGP